MKTPLMVVAFIGLLGFATGCKPSNPVRPASTPMPPEVAEQISTADRIVVATNSFHPFGSEIAGEDVPKLAKAVASSRHYVGQAFNAIFDWDIEFYRGTNLLTTIHMQGSAFVLNNTEYFDETEVLETFGRELVERERGRR